MLANDKNKFQKMCTLQKNIEMGHLTISSKILDKYFGFLINLDNNSKKRLIIRLTESIETEKKENTDLSMLFGAWIDERDSDEINSEIRNSRIEKQNIAEFFIC